MRLLFEASLIQGRVEQLASDISASHVSEEPLVLVCVLKGGLVFTADLMRQLTIPVQLDTLQLSSYGGGTASGPLKWEHHIPARWKGKHLLLIDDVFDTGQTLSAARLALSKLPPASLRTCVLVRKNKDENLPVDFVGFHANASDFLVGYGMDCDQNQRHLPSIYTLGQSI